VLGKTSEVIIAWWIGDITGQAASNEPPGHLIKKNAYYC